MRIHFCPIVSTEIIQYEFNDEAIRVIFQEKSDSFDFKGVPEGQLEKIETEIEVNPVSGAKKENGLLTVSLIIFIDEKEDEKRLLYPQPISVKEAQDLIQIANDRTRFENEVVEDGRNYMEVTKGN